MVDEESICTMHNRLTSYRSQTAQCQRAWPRQRGMMGYPLGRGEARESLVLGLGEQAVFGCESGWRALKAKQRT